MVFSSAVYLSEQISAVNTGLEIKYELVTNPAIIRDAYSQYAFLA